MDILQNVGLAVITGLIIAPLSSYITVRLSFAKFKDERRWEKRFHAYENLLNALHTIKQYNINWENAFRTDKVTPAQEKLESLDVKREEAMDLLEKEIDIGGFILPTDVISYVRSMLMDMRALEYTEENYHECYERENEIVDKALEKLRYKSI